MSDKYMYRQVVQVGENVYLLSHINVFWLACADGITPAFFMVWWLYLDWKEVLYNACYIHHYSWEFHGTTTGLLLPETSLCSYLGGKWDQTMLTPPALQVTL